VIVQVGAKIDGKFSESGGRLKTRQVICKGVVRMR